jgi:hypothetical protein
VALVIRCIPLLSKPLLQRALGDPKKAIDNRPILIIRYRMIGRKVIVQEIIRIRTIA